MKARVRLVLAQRPDDIDRLPLALLENIGSFPVDRSLLQPIERSLLRHHDRSKFDKLDRLRCATNNQPAWRNRLQEAGFAALFLG